MGRRAKKRAANSNRRGLQYPSLHYAMIVSADKNIRSDFCFLVCPAWVATGFSAGGNTVHKGLKKLIRIRNG